MLALRIESRENPSKKHPIRKKQFKLYYSYYHPLLKKNSSTMLEAQQFDE